MNGDELHDHRFWRDQAKVDIHGAGLEWAEGFAAGWLVHGPRRRRRALVRVGEVPVVRWCSCTDEGCPGR